LQILDVQDDGLCTTERSAIFCRITLTLIRSVVVLSFCTEMGVLLSVAESDSTVNANSQDIYVKAVYLVLAPEGSLPCCSVCL
jgi:hypothetical protein